MRLKDKVAIITGAARGIGKAIALAFAREGADIVVADLNLSGIEATAAEAKALGRRAYAIKADVSIWDDVDRMVKSASQEFGRVDILINNAAIYAGITRKPFYEVTEEEWDRLMAVNLKGVFLCCKAVFPFMKEQGKGKIVNIASSVHFWGSPYFIHYTTSKGGVVAFTRAMARELGIYKINVNAVAPGFTMTEASGPLATKEHVDFVTSIRSLKRQELAEDLIGAAVFLSSEESDFVTGQTIVVDGGIVMH